MSWRLLALLCLYSCRSLQPGESQLEIAGGRSTNSYPAVGLFDINNGGGTCTGTLISPRVVLTAAHCVTGESFPPFKLNQSMNFLIGGKNYAGERWVLHPGYNNYIYQCLQPAPLASQKRYKEIYDCEGHAMGDSCDQPCETCYRSAECQTCIKRYCQAKNDSCLQDPNCAAIRRCEVKRTIDEMPNDMALVILKKTVLNVEPVRLGRQPTSGETIELVGFGPRSMDRPDTLGSKSKGTNQISEVYAESYTYQGSSIGRANLLGGDSGGPSFVSRAGVNVLLGVHSNTSSVCNSAGEPVGVDMRVEAYLDWIRKESPEPLP